MNKISFWDMLKFKWYSDQLKGWSKKSYWLLYFGIGLILGTTISQPISFLSLVTMGAAMIGFTTNISITNAKPLNGLFGLTGALMYCYVSFHAKNYNEIALQITYFLLLDLPILLKPSWAKNVQQHIKSLIIKNKIKKSLTNTIGVVIIFLGVYIILFELESHFTNSPRPLIDSFTATSGIMAALLTTLRFQETFFFWSMQGICSIILWGVTAMQGDANLTLFFTYILYLVNDVLAFFDKSTPWFSKINK